MAAADDIRRINEEISSLARRLGKGPLKVFEPSELAEARATLSGLRYEFSEMEGSATNIYDKLRGVTSELRGQETATQGIRKAFRSISADATKLKNDEQEIERLTSKELRSLQQRVRVNKTKLADDQRRLLAENDIAKEISRQVDDLKRQGAEQDLINEYVSDYLKSTTDLTEEQQAMLLSYFDQNKAVEELLSKTQERLRLEEEIDKKVRGFTALADLASSIPGLRALAGPFKEAEKAARVAAERGENVLKAGGKGLAKAFGPISIALSAFNAVLKLLFDVDKQVTEIGKAQGLSAYEANNYREQIQAAAIASKDVVVTTKSLLQAQTELSKTAGATRGFTLDELEAQTALTERVGIQVGSAAKLANLSRINGQTSKSILTTVSKQTAELQAQTGISLDSREILNEIAEVQGQLSANYKNAPNLIAAAVVQTRRLGLTLSQAADMSSKLLDFESSIEAELEAELLVGRDLNLERARSLALQGKSAEAAAELAKNFGSLEDFQSLSVIQQNALAKAMGMTADELANALVQQKNLSLLGEETRKQVQDRVNQLRSEGKVAEANALLNVAANAKDREEMLLRLDAQKKFNLALEKAKDVFSSIIASLPLLKGILVSIGVVLAGIAISAITTASAFTLGLGAVAIGAGIATAIASMESAKRQATKVQDAVIDPNGGLLVTGQKGSIQLDKDDSIVAGTNLRGGSNNSELIKRIDRLIQVVEKGGNVYIDGSKVGYSLALASTKI